MRRFGSYLTALAAAGLIGFFLGFIVGFREWAPAWLTLSLLKSVRTGAVAWLIGIALSPALGFVLSRRHPSSATSSRRAGRVIARAALITLGLAPAILWLPGLGHIGEMRKAAAIGRRPGDHRPNLVLITIDAQRADYLGAYGSSRGLTPNLDAFARDATRYDCAYASSPWTLTSLAALFTSLPPSGAGLKTPHQKTGAWYRPAAKLPEDRALLSELLQRAGYATAADLTNVFLESDRGWTRGFDYYRNEGGADGTNSDNAIARTLTRNGLAWLTLNWRQPYFLWLHYLDPHCPYSSPDTPEALRARYPEHWVARRDRWYYGIRNAPAKEQALFKQFCRDMYAEEVRYADKWVGELLRGLKARGMYDDSLIVITADHGEELFDRGGMDHGHSLHEEVLHVPLLVKWPKGVAADRVVTHTVPMRFIAGTLLQLAKAPALNGANQALPMRNSQAASEVYSEGLLYGTERTALTTDKYKIVYHPYEGSGNDQFEVYDRSSDRRERHNLASTNAASDLRHHLRALTEGADRTAAQVTSDPTVGALNISDDAKRRMRSLGYLGK